MSFKSGCLRPALFGCGGLLAVVVVGIAIVSVVAVRGVKRERVEDRALDTGAEMALADRDAATATLPPGQVILELSEGEFYVHPGEPGNGVRVTARFDQQSFALADSLEILADGSWVYTVRYRRTIPTFQALLQTLFGGSQESRVDVYLPPDVPLALQVRVQNGAGETELGGLWLTEALIEARRGGFSLGISEPLREPMELLVLDGAMGGLDAQDLGNASPRTLDVQWRMGGASIDLSGRWVRDCDVNLSVDMGGMAVLAPRDLEIEHVGAGERELQPPPDESAPPVLRVRMSQKRGEIDMVRH